MKRHLFKLVLFLVLGAIVNVAVAWGCAYWINLTSIIPRGTSPKRYSMSTWQVFDHFDRMGASRMAWRLPPFIVTGVGTLNIDSYIQTLPQEDVPHMQLGEVLDRRGFPMLSMECEFINTTDKPWNPIYQVEYGIMLETTPGSDERGLRAIPLRIVWLGFVFNTIIYAVFLWLLTLAPFTARRMIRRKRGRCIKCGYDLRNVEHEKCPECGIAVSPASAASG